MGAGCPRQTAGGAPQGRERRTWFSEALGARPSRAPGGPRAATALPPPYSRGLEGGEGRTGGPCDHLQARLEPPKQTAVSKILKHGSSGGAVQQGPGGPRGGDAGCLADQGRGAGWPWRGGRTTGRGRRERVLGD